MFSGEGRQVKVANIAGLAEVCEIIEYTDGYVTQLLADPEAAFPKPLTSIKAGRIWDAAEVRAWKQAWDVRQRRGPGRPKKDEPVVSSAENRRTKLDALLGRLA